MEFLYKFACFDCRLAFKRQAEDGTCENSAHKADSKIVHLCPNCGHRMAFMGRNFSTPSKSNISAWGAAKVLWEAGFRYSGSGYHSDSVLPTSKNEAYSFIIRNPNHAQKVGRKMKWVGYA